MFLLKSLIIGVIFTLMSKLTTRTIETCARKFDTSYVCKTETTNARKSPLKQFLTIFTEFKSRPNLCKHPLDEVTHLGYPPVGLGDRRVLIVFRVDGQVYGHRRPSPPLFGVHFATGRWRQILRIRPCRQVR